VRGAAATWTAIVDMVAPEGSAGRVELLAATGLAASLIAAEGWRDAPAVVSGVGPQLRVYCLYGEDAILGEDTNEDALSWSPTDGDWTMAMPCPSPDLGWVRDAAAELSARLEIVELTTAREAATAPSSDSSGLSIDVAEFLRG
jgi:hypothetical protein